MVCMLAVLVIFINTDFLVLQRIILVLPWHHMLIVLNQIDECIGNQMEDYAN